MANVDAPKVRKFSKMIALAVNGSNDNERLTALNQAAKILVSENKSVDEMFITMPVLPIVNNLTARIEKLMKENADLLALLSDKITAPVAMVPGRIKKGFVYCEHCSAHFETNSGLRRHIKNKHSDIEATK